MTAPTQRPNFLLVWIGILILVMTLGMRALVPGSAPHEGREVNGAVPAAPVAPVTEPSVPVVQDPPPPADPLATPYLNQGTLAEGASSLPGLIPAALEHARPVDAGVSTLAGLGAADPAEQPVPAGPTRLERLEPASLLSGYRPRPARAESVSAEPPSRGADRAAAPHAVLVSFHRADLAQPAAAAGAAALDPASTPPDEALIVEVAPDSFLAVVVLGTPTVNAQVAADAWRSADAGADSEAESDDGDGAARRDPPAPREWLAELRDRLLSRAERGELAIEDLQRFREEMVRCWNSQDPALRRLLVLDLDRRELTGLLSQMAERAQNPAD